MYVHHAVSSHARCSHPHQFQLLRSRALKHSRNDTENDATLCIL